MSQTRRIRGRGYCWCGRWQLRWSGADRYACIALSLLILRGELLLLLLLWLLFLSKRRCQVLCKGRRWWLRLRLLLLALLHLSNLLLLLKLQLLCLQLLELQLLLLLQEEQLRVLPLVGRKLIQRKEVGGVVVRGNRDCLRGIGVEAAQLLCRYRDGSRIDSEHRGRHRSRLQRAACVLYENRSRDRSAQCGLRRDQRRIREWDKVL